MPRPKPAPLAYVGIHLPSPDKLRAKKLAKSQGRSLSSQCALFIRDGLDRAEGR